jgi:hypothetical protein
MSNLSRAVRITLVTAALAASSLTSLAQAAVAAVNAESPRKTIESMAKGFHVAAGEISYIGLDGKPMTQAAFYQTLDTNPAQKWKGEGTIARSSKTAGIPIKMHIVKQLNQ